MKTIRLLIVTLLSACVCNVGAQTKTSQGVVNAEDSLVSINDSITIAPTDSLPYPQRAIVKLDSICSSKLMETSQLGIMVYDLDADSAIYKKGERQLLRPASTMKLVTAITALDQLGRKYRFRTAVYHSGYRDSTTLRGDIFVTGTMDPTLRSNDIDRFVSAIAKMGIDSICGNIVTDRSFKDNNLLGEGWCWDDDNPVLSPIVCDRGDNLSSILRSKIEARGIVIAGTDSIGALPADAKLIDEHNTSLENVLTKMMKESDNLYAESMYYNIGAIEGRPATAKAAQAKERETIRRAGADSSSYRLADGSGLSLYNYITAETEVLLLRYAYKNKNIFGTLCPSLPTAGVDGTLKKRMTKEPVYHNVRAKTGTITGVVALAGYCKSPERHMLAFCIINQGVMRGREARAFQDSVCEAISK